MKYYKYKVDYFPLYLSYISITKERGVVLKSFKRIVKNKRCILSNDLIQIFLDHSNII